MPFPFFSMADNSAFFPNTKKITYTHARSAPFLDGVRYLLQTLENLCISEDFGTNITKNLFNIECQKN